MAIVTTQTETRELDRTASVTAHLVAPEVFEQSFGSNATWGTMMTFVQRAPWTGGDDTMQIPVNLAIPGKATSYRGFEQLPDTPNKTRTAALFTASEYGSPLVVSQRDLDTVAGSAAALGGLMKIEMGVSMDDLLDRLNKDFWRDGTTKSTDFPGFAAAVPADPTSDTYGGVSSSANSDWQNAFIDNSNTTADTILDFRNTKTNATIGSKKPTIMFGGRTERDLLEGKLVATFEVDPIVIARGGEGSGQIERLKFGDARFVVDENRVSYGGGTGNVVVFINPDSWRMAVKPSDFGQPIAGTPDIRMDNLHRGQNQTAFSAYLRWFGTWFTKERRLNGVTFGLAAA